jgi:hypothetical protein
MKKLFKTLAIVAIFGIVAFAGSAWAQGYGGGGTTVGLTGVASTLGGVFDEVRTVFYVLAAFGLIGLAAGALLGKIQWKWLWALVFGVAVVACADYVIKFATQGKGEADIGEGFVSES